MTVSNAIRFRLTPEAAERLLQRKRIAGAKVAGRSVRRSVERFYDTPGLSFFKSGVAYSVQEGGDADRHALQQIGTAPEWIRPVRRQCLQLDLLEAEANPSAQNGSGSIYQHVFTLRQERHELKLKAKGCVLFLYIMRGQIETEDRNGQVLLEDFCEAELSHKAEAGLALHDVSLRLLQVYDVRLQPQSLVARGFALSGDASGLKHAKAEPTVLDRGMTVGDGLQAACRNIMGHLLQNEAAALSGQPNGIHQTRVAIRRFRAALRAFKKALPYEGRKAYNGELRWIQQSTGPARDWHVFLDETLKLVGPADIGAGEIARLKTRAKSRRREHSLEAAEVLVSRRYTRLLLRFGRWLRKLEQSGGDALARPIEPFARKAIAKAHRDLLAGIAAVREGVLEDMHKVRIDAKKARYAVEFFQSLFDPESTQAYLDLVKQMQDKLGEANDARTARALIAELDLEDFNPETAGTFLTWAENRIEDRLHMAGPGLEALKNQPLQLERNETPIGGEDTLQHRYPLAGEPETGPH
ncbi:MAG: CHAD domain-containing protein [Pseudomonadota bacterium]